MSNCRSCQAEMKSAYNRSGRGKARARAWKARNREYSREYERKYSKSPAGKKRFKKYKKKIKDQNQLELEKLSADFPVDVVFPYVLSLYVKFRNSTERNNAGEWLGVTNMAKEIGIDDKILRNILNKKCEAVSLKSADKICLYADFNLNELTDDAEVWSQENGGVWPSEFLPNKKRSKVKL